MAKLVINIETKVVEVKYGKQYYRDTINMTPLEEEMILSSFKRNKINELSGEVFYNDYLRLPPNNLVMNLYENGNLKTRLSVSYDFKNKDPEIPYRASEVMKFKDDVARVLNAQPEVKKALKIFSKWNDEDMKSYGKPLKR